MTKVCTIFSTLAFLAFYCVAEEPKEPEKHSKLNIAIVEGEGAINNIQLRTAREPIVQVTDENDRPVAGAAVVFLLPGTGAGGSFVDGAKMLTIMTDQNGRAVARNLVPNNVAGEFQINVTASHLGQTASATITQTNALTGAAASAAGGTAAGAGGATSAGGAAGGAAAAAGIGKVIAIVAIVAGAAAAGGIVAATKGGSAAPAAAAPPRQTTTIVPGTPVVNTPH